MQRTQLLPPLFPSSTVLCFPACFLSDTPVLPVLSQVSSWMREKANNTNMQCFLLDQLMLLVMQFCDHRTGEQKGAHLFSHSASGSCCWQWENAALQLRTEGEEGIMTHVVSSCSEIFNGGDCVWFVLRLNCFPQDKVGFCCTPVSCRNDLPRWTG